MAKVKTAELLKELDERNDKVQPSKEFKEMLEFFLSVRITHITTVF